jgi:hypothetical protein
MLRVLCSARFGNALHAGSNCRECKDHDKPQGPLLLCVGESMSVEELANSSTPSKFSHIGFGHV